MSNPGSPVSASVGSSGASAERFAVVTASAFNLPAFSCGVELARLSNMSWVSPASNACSAGPVVDDDGLAPGLRELLSDRPRHDVERAARWKGDDQADRLGRIRLCARGLRHKSDAAGEHARDGSNDAAAKHMHAQIDP